MDKVKKLKVVQLSSVHASIDTRIFHKICKSLVANGFDLDLIIQHQKNEIKEGVNIIALPIAKKKSDRLLKIIPKLFLKCIKYSRNTVFHFHDPELIPVGFILKLLNYKVIYDVHEDVAKSIEGKEWIPQVFRTPASYIINTLERIGVLFFDRIIVVTPAIQSRMDSPGTVMIQNFPILSSNESLIISKKENSIFYIGFITKIRGILEVIRALEIVNKTESISLILGGGISPSGFEKELTEEPGWKYVKFTGWIDRKDFYSYANKSFAGIVTFHPLPNHIEAQPNKLFEYMNASLPIIASNFPLWSKIVKENNCGIMVDPLSPIEIADAILELYRKPEQTISMGQNGKKVVDEKYSWSVEEKKLITLYEELAN